MGSYISIQNDTSDVWYAKVGADQAAISIAGKILGGLSYIIGPAVTVVGAVLGVATTGPTGVAGGTATSVNLISHIQEHLEKQGMKRLEPGQAHSWGMSLSLWRQCECIGIRVNPKKPGELFINRFYMRPIFSGATDGSTNVHTMQYWINKNGLSTQTISIA